MLNVFEHNCLCKQKFFSYLFLKFLLNEICPTLGICVSWPLYWKRHLTECDASSPCDPDFDINVLDAKSFTPSTLVSYFKIERIGLNLLGLFKF